MSEPRPGEYQAIAWVNKNVTVTGNFKESGGHMQLTSIVFCDRPVPDSDNSILVPSKDVPRLLSAMERIMAFAKDES